MRLLLVLAAVMLAPWLSPVTLAQQPTTREITFPVTIRWDRQKGINKYRLQIAADEKFQNVFFDRRLIGDRYVVRELSPGYYYWRVATAESRLGDFSRPQRFFISGGVITPVKLPGHASRATLSRSLSASRHRTVQPESLARRFD